jgi:hypothetical protein
MTASVQFVPASVSLEKLHRQVSSEEVTVGSVLERLEGQSFGLLLLLLGIVGVVPGICTLAGVLIGIMGFEMLLGRTEPYFPRWISGRTVRTRRVRPVITFAIAVLRRAEKVIHPRWLPMTRRLTRLVGLVIILASVRLFVVPVPFSNVLPAMIVAVLSLAFLEEDGLFLSLALVLAVANLALDSALVWRVVAH